MKIPASSVLEWDIHKRVRFTEAGTNNQGINLEVFSIRASLLLVENRVVRQLSVELLRSYRDWFAHLGAGE